MHHKRGRAKRRRSGCLFCKPHKGNGTKSKFASQTYQEQKARFGDVELGLRSLLPCNFAAGRR